MALETRKFELSMFAKGCQALNHCRNPSRPEFYVFRGMSVDETIAAIHKRQSAIASKSNPPEHITKLKEINAGQNNPASLSTAMKTAGSFKTAKATLKARRALSRGFSGKSHSAETRRHMAVLRSQQAKVVTKPELVIWGMLHAIGVEFEYQYPVGVYVVDFYVPSKKLVIDVFGDYWHGRAMKSQHEATKKQESDDRRQRAIESSESGFLILWESEIMQNPRDVVEKLRCALSQ